MTRTGLFAGQKRLRSIRPLLTAFTTFNMKQAHCFKYAFSLTMAEKKFETRGESIYTTLIAASEDNSTEAPPPPFPAVEAQYPPAFEDVIQESRGPGPNVTADTKAFIAAEMGRA